jgi:LSM domain
VKLNANRQVTGTMRGFDQFMNVVLDKAHDDKTDTELGMVVRTLGMLRRSKFWRPALLESIHQKLDDCFGVFNGFHETGSSDASLQYDSMLWFCQNNTLLVIFPLLFLRVLESVMHLIGTKITIPATAGGG